MHRKIILTGILVAFLGTITAYPNDPGIASSKVETESETSRAENYRLSVNDLVNVKVFQEDDLTTSIRIAADGTISIPLIGQVKIAGSTAQGAAEHIARLLDARFLVNPQVTVTVTGYARRRFTVLGQVQKSGAYNMQFQDSIDLLEAIGMAGGYTRLANPAKITVRRRVGERESVFELNGKELANGQSGKSFRIQAGDTITVGERMF